MKRLRILALALLIVATSLSQAHTEDLVFSQSSEILIVDGSGGTTGPGNCC